MPTELIDGYRLDQREETDTPPPSYLTPDQVAAAADWLAQRPFADVVESVDPETNAG
jgi:hypothetical protein